jgi:transcriptional regulator with GAF, ATPase, and Fis domain
MHVGILTYVLSYDDLTREDAVRLPALGLDVLDLAIGRAGSGEATHLDSKGLRIRDPLVSRSHARVWCDGTKDTLTDLGSKHGTSVNGQPITKHVLQDGDLIGIGHSLLVYRSVDEATAILLKDQGAPELGPTRTLSPAVVRMVDQIERIARTGLSVLLLGETGTGKDVVAHQIHELSGRPGKLASINCGAISASLIEAELFGHEKGAHSLADRGRTGLLRSADGGTVLLDEIGEMPEDAQVKLLRVLQHGEVTPVGADRPQRIDVLWISATNADVHARDARLRKDVLARLGQIVIELPALRDRREDLGLLAAHILARCPVPPGGAIPTAIESDAGWRLFSGPLALNVRGLEDTLRRAALVARGKRMTLSDLGPLAVAEEGEEEDDVRPAPPTAPQPVAGPERHTRPPREVIESALEQNGQVIGAAARVLGVHEKQLRRWIEHYGITKRPPPR